MINKYFLTATLVSGGVFEGVPDVLGQLVATVGAANLAHYERRQTAKAEERRKS